MYSAYNSTWNIVILQKKKKFPQVLFLNIILLLPSTNFCFYKTQSSKISLCKKFFKIFSLSAKVLQLLYSQKEKLPLALNHIHHYSYTVSMAYIGGKNGFQDKLG